MIDAVTTKTDWSYYSEMYANGLMRTWCGLCHEELHDDGAHLCRVRLPVEIERLIARRDRENIL